MRLMIYGVMQVDLLKIITFVLLIIKLLEEPFI